MEKQHPQSVHGTEKDRQYGAFQNELYRGDIPISVSMFWIDWSIAGMFHQRLPLVTTDPRKLEGQAKSVLKPTAYNYGVII